MGKLHSEFISCKRYNIVSCEGGLKAMEFMINLLNLQTLCNPVDVMARPLIWSQFVLLLVIKSQLHIKIGRKKYKKNVLSELVSF